MKYILGTCVVIGILVVIGTAGASDCGALEFGQAVVRSICGLAVSIGGVIGLNVLG